MCIIECLELFFQWQLWIFSSWDRSKVVLLSVMWDIGSPSRILYEHSVYNFVFILRSNCKDVIEHTNYNHTCISINIPRFCMQMNTFILQWLWQQTPWSYIRLSHSKLTKILTKIFKIDWEIIRKDDWLVKIYYDILDMSLFMAIFLYVDDLKPKHAQDCCIWIFVQW